MKHQGNGFLWLDLGSSTPRKTGAVGETAHGERTVSVNYEQ